MWANSPTMTRELLKIGILSIPLFLEFKNTLWPKTKIYQEIPAQLEYTNVPPVSLWCNGDSSSDVCIFY